MGKLNLETVDIYSNYSFFYTLLKKKINYNQEKLKMFYFQTSFQGN